MLKVHIAITPTLKTKIRAAITRKSELLAQFERGEMTDQSLQEIATIDLTLSKFGEAVFKMAETMEESGAGVSKPRTIH